MGDVVPIDNRRWFFPRGVVRVGYRCGKVARALVVTLLSSISSQIQVR